MRAILLILAGAAIALGADTKADDGWNKVKELKSGTEIRIFKKGGAQPILAKAGDATDDRLIVIIKNAETAVSKNDIDHIDARPSAKRAVVHTTTTTADPTTKTVDGVRPENYPAPSTSSGGGVSFGSKPDFETIYRRRPPSGK